MKGLVNDCRLAHSPLLYLFEFCRPMLSSGLKLKPSTMSAHEMCGRRQHDPCPVGQFQDQDSRYIRLPPTLARLLPGTESILLTELKDFFNSLTNNLSRQTASIAQPRIRSVTGFFASGENAGLITADDIVIEYCGFSQTLQYNPASLIPPLVMLRPLLATPRPPREKRFLSRRGLYSNGKILAPSACEEGE